MATNGIYEEDGSLRTTTTLRSSDVAAIGRGGSVYRSTTAYPTTAGDGILFICTVAGTSTVTFSGGGSVVIPIPVGMTILPFSASTAVVTTGTMTIFKLSY